jgi:hypothetical protein
MGTLFGLLLIVGAVIHYFWWLVAAAVVVGTVWYGRILHLAWRMTEAAEARQRNAVRARADQQQAWRLAGDPRGVYGSAWSTVREYEDLVDK